MIPCCGGNQLQDCDLRLAQDPFPTADPTATNEPGAITITGLRGLSSLAGCTSCNGARFIQPYNAPMRPMGDLFSDIQGAIDKSKSAVDDASSQLGKTIGASLKDAVTTAVEKNPLAAKSIVASGVAIGVGVILSVGLIGYLVGHK